MNKKFKKMIATGLAVTSVVTVGGGVAKYHHDKKDQEYTIESGDTLYDISTRHYGSNIYYDDIAEYNHIENPDDIKAGDVIKLPNKIGDAVKTTEQTYTIEIGDSLISICVKFYKDNSYETALRLAAYNNIEDANKIKAGDVITIPSYEEVLKINPYPYDYEIDQNMKR